MYMKLRIKNMKLCCRRCVHLPSANSCTILCLHLMLCVHFNTDTDYLHIIMYLIIMCTKGHLTVASALATK